MNTLSWMGVNLLGKFISTLERSLLFWTKPLPVVILAGLIYIGLSATAVSPWGLSDAPYYNLLADAFLHGQFHLRIIPENPIDLSLFQGQYFLYWGPLPAIMAIPFVALFGVEASDILQTLIFSTINVGILVMVLQAAAEHRVIRISPLQRSILVLFFALGTAYTPITGTGHVWQMAQVDSIFFAFLAFLAAFKLRGGKAFFYTGLAIAGAFLTRPSTIFISVFLAWYLIRQNWHPGCRRIVQYCILGILPIVSAFLLTGIYNYLRFDNPLDNGLAYHLMSNYFASDFSRYGVFNIRYLPANIYYTYFFYPFSLRPPGITVRCGSMFLLSPLFFTVFIAIWKSRREAITWVLLAAIILANIPILMLMGPGSSLFGPRYTLDFIMPLLLLTAMGMEYFPMSLTSMTVVISILHYLLGSLIYFQGVN